MPLWIDHILREHAFWAYVVLFAWTFLEGETVLIICGGLASLHGRHLNIVLVIATALAGSVIGDNMWFLIGRHKGKAFLAKRPGWDRQAAKIYRLLERHQNWLMVGFRFLYGVRNLTPFALGISNVNARKFMIFNLIGATLWATAFGLGGYFLFEWLKDNKVEHHLRVYMLIGIGTVVFVTWLTRTIWRSIKARRAKACQIEGMERVN